jgi:hypothetical protein
MYLYKLEQTENDGYDTYSSAIVAAESKKRAKQIRPDRMDWDYEDKFPTWAFTPKGVKVTLIGKAVEGTQEGVVLASFHAS